MTTVYLAGPMQQWTDRGRGNGEMDFHRDPALPAPWRSEVMRRARRVKYLFPEMIEFWGHAHDTCGAEIPQQDIDMIRRCDLLIAYIDQPDRIGTFCEIAAAYALNKKIRIVSTCKIAWFVKEFDDGSPIHESINPVDLIVEFCGGDSIDYYKYIQSSEWRLKADEAKERAGQRCQVCYRPASEVTLDAHHRTYERLGNESPEDITVLCRGCHSLYESRKKIIKTGGLDQ